MWTPPKDWRDEFDSISKRAEETTWGFPRDMQIQMWLIRELEAAELKLEVMQESHNKMRGVRLENGRLKKQLEQLKEKMAKAKEDEEAFVKHMSDSIQFD
ncbi:MAG: hypothetical protein ACYS8I_14365, partial [Planctomycetota bacterium]